MAKPRKKKRARATPTGRRSAAAQSALPGVVDLGLYIGAPITHRRLGRPRVEASCGHPVWVDPSWQRAKSEGKRLLCLDCVQAIAEEHDALLVVYRRGAEP